MNILLVNAAQGLSSKIQRALSPTANAIKKTNPAGTSGISLPVYKANLGHPAYNVQTKYGIGDVQIRVDGPCATHTDKTSIVYTLPYFNQITGKEEYLSVSVPPQKANSGIHEGKSIAAWTHNDSPLTNVNGANVAFPDYSVVDQHPHLRALVLGAQGQHNAQQV